MKKFFKKTIVLLLSLLLMVSFAGTAMALDTVKIYVDGMAISTDVPARVANGRTMVSVRPIFEALNATVNWNEDTQTITAVRNDTKISLVLNNARMFVNGNAVALDTAAQSINGRTMVPLRAVSEAFGAITDWSTSESTVRIFTSKSTYDQYQKNKNTTTSNSNDSVSKKEFTWSVVDALLHNSHIVMTFSSDAMEYCLKVPSVTAQSQVRYLKLAVQNGNFTRSSLADMITILEQREDLICDDGNTVLSAAKNAYDVLGNLDDVKISTSNISTALKEITGILYDSGQNILRVENALIDLAESFT